MSRRAAGALVALALVLLVVGLVRSRRAASPYAPGGPQEVAAKAAAPETPAQTRTVTLWLPGPAGKLGARQVEVASSPEPRARLRALLAALLTAPEAGDLSPVFPVPVEVGATVFGGDGTLYVDLRAADGAEPPGAGSTLEMQRVFAIVHTVIRNEPGIARVALLWNGAQRLSLCGHVDTSAPLAPRPDLEAN